MRISTLPAVALLLTACAANSPREDVADQPTASSPQPTASSVLASTSANEDAERIVQTPLGPVTEVVATPNDEAITGVVCEVRPRPGSRVKERVCMSRAAYNATREAAQEQLSVAQRQQQQLEETIRENEMNDRRGGGFSPGPR